VDENPVSGWTVRAVLALPRFARCVPAPPGRPRHPAPGGPRHFAPGRRGISRIPW